MKENEGADFTHVVNPKNILVRNLAGEKQFLLEALERRSFTYNALANNFYGDHAVERFVAGLVDAAHSSLSEKRLDVIARAEIAARLESRHVHHANSYIIANGHHRTTVGA